MFTSLARAKSISNSIFIIFQLNYEITVMNLNKKKLPLNFSVAIKDELNFRELNKESLVFIEIKYLHHIIYKNSNTNVLYFHLNQKRKYSSRSKMWKIYTANLHFHNFAVLWENSASLESCKKNVFSSIWKH